MLMSIGDCDFPLQSVKTEPHDAWSGYERNKKKNSIIIAEVARKDSVLAIKRNDISSIFFYLQFLVRSDSTTLCLSLGILP